jgi:hypothetical protein
MGIKQNYARKKLKKIAGTIQHNPILPSVEKAKLIGVIWQPSQKEAFQYLKSYFNREQIVFREFCVFEEDLNPISDTNTLTIKDLNWLGFPKPEKTDDFSSIQFDILFNIASKQNLILDYLTIISKAKFKVGNGAEDSNYFDLNINIGKKDDAIYIVKQQIFYLAQLNKTTSK